MCYPIITYPYITRIFIVEDIGKINFYLSIITYFQLLAFLGIPTYAISIGSGNRNNKVWIGKFTNEIYTISILATCLSCFGLAIVVLVRPGFLGDWKIWVALGSTLVFSTIGADWLLQVFEDYFYMTVRYIATQLLGIVLLFLFVKDSSDLYLYFYIYAMSFMITGILNRLYTKKYCFLRIISKLNMAHHLKVLIPILLANLTTMIYINSDITMLGIICGEKSVGIYSTAAKVYNAVKNILCAIIAVYIPGLSLMLQQNNLILYKKKVFSLIRNIIMLSLAAASGLIGLSNEIIELFAGPNYVEGSMSLRILSITLIFAALNGINTTAILILDRKEKKVLLATSVSAVINFTLNLCLLPIFQYNGAALTTLTAEGVLFFITTYECNKKNMYTGLIRKLKYDVIAVIPMIIVIIIITKTYIGNLWIRCICAAVLGTMWYVRVGIYRNRRATEE